MAVRADAAFCVLPGAYCLARSFENRHRQEHALAFMRLVVAAAPMLEYTCVSVGREQYRLARAVPRCSPLVARRSGAPGYSLVAERGGSRGRLFGVVGATDGRGQPAEAASSSCVSVCALCLRVSLGVCVRGRADGRL